MSAHHARPRARWVAYLSALMTVFLVGCGGNSTTSGPVGGQDPQAGSRRKEMADYQKQQESGGATTGSNKSP